MAFSSYVICATPRSGSTLLCDLLAGSGIAGDPHSYFRPADIREWAEAWGLSGPTDPDDQEFNRAYVAAVDRASRGGTGIFGLRLMWDSVAEATRRLGHTSYGETDLPTQIADVFGPALFIHLSRRDKAAQAVSYVRAQQTGLWHRASDGSERERVAPARRAYFDRAELLAARDGFERDDAAWNTLFQTCGIDPLRLVYEDLAADPRGTLANILTRLGRDPAAAERAEIVSGRMADATSRRWIELLRSGDGA